MKPMEKDNRVFSTSSNETSFQTKASAKSFDILSNKIYEHKIRAVIRETACNANDSHVCAGKRDVPFRVHLPTQLHPFFEIEDYGVGLDDEEIRGREVVLYDENGEEVSRQFEGGVYTTYFASTKTQDTEEAKANDQIGAMGLGSKSPLAYTKSMLIRARKNGVERHYNCYIGEDGTPKVSFDAERNTDESNGVMVKFSVASEDFDSFHEEAEYIFSFFKVLPETNTPITPMLDEEQRVKLIDDGAIFLSRDSRIYNHVNAPVCAVMGGVPYPVQRIEDSSYLSREFILNESSVNIDGAEPDIFRFDPQEVKFYESFLMENRPIGEPPMVLVSFPMGSLDFAASRETLSLDPTTKLNFYRGVVSSVSRAKDVIVEEVNSSGSVLEALINYSKYFPPYGMFANDCYYRGITIQELYAKKMSVGKHNDGVSIYRQQKATSARYRYSGKTVVNLNTNIVQFGMGSLFEVVNKGGEGKRVTFVHVEEDKKELRGYLKAVKPFVKECTSGVLFLSKEPPSQDLLNRMEFYFGGRLDVMTASELISEIESEWPGVYGPKGRKSSSRGYDTRITKREIRAASFMDGMELPAERIDIDSIDMSRTFAIYREYGEVDPFAYREERNLRWDIDDISWLYKRGFDKYFDNVIFLNKSNMGKAKRLGIPSLGDFLRDNIDLRLNYMIEQAGLYIDAQMVEHMDLCNLLKTSYLGTEKSHYLDLVMEHDLDVQREIVEPFDDLKKSFSEYHGFMDMRNYRFRNLMEIIFPGADEDIKKEVEFQEKFGISKQLEDLKTSATNHYNWVIKKKYPILFDDDEGGVIEYIKFMNEKDSQSKIA